MQELPHAAALAHEGRITDDLKQLGVSGPVPILSSAERVALERHLDSGDLPAPLDWWKGCAATDKTIYDIATKPQLIAWLRPLLGDDIVLWGAMIVRKPPGKSHPWHTDMESADPHSRVVTVWIGIRNAGEGSGLHLVAGSHQFGICVQEVLANSKEERTAITDERMLEIARALNPSVRIVDPQAQDGQAVLLDGRIWHCSHNDGKMGTRTALLLQYASADTPIPMPANPSYAWPFKFAKKRRVPAILVSGTDRWSANRLVPPPQRQRAPMITTLARTVALPLPEDPVKRWRPYPQFRGPTRTLGDMSCHISVLSAGHCPHPPHIHREEELLVVLDGEVEIELAEDANSTGSRRHPLKPGMFSYYPATQHHTIHNVGAAPATYLMFKWHARMANTGGALPASIFEYDVAGVPPNGRPIAYKLLFQQATGCLGKLQAHQTILQPGAGYEPHADAYDVAIVVLSGEVETIGQRIGPVGVIYYSAGDLHGMRNVGNTPAVYLVFEFHGPAAGATKHQRAEARRRKRGVRGLIRKVVKAVRELVR